MTPSSQHKFSLYTAIISTLVTIGLVVVGFIAKEIYYTGIETGKKLEIMNNILTEKSVILDNACENTIKLENRVSTLEVSDKEQDIRLTKLEYKSYK
jgi:hypothetical protein